MNKLKGRHFIDLDDFNKEELETILQVAFDLKARTHCGETQNILAGKSLGMLFTHPSTRTRISFETAMTQLGGHAQFYAPEHLQIGGTGEGEEWKDTAQVISRYVDGIVARISPVPGLFDLKYGEGNEILKLMAANSSVPVINAGCDLKHPCQVMADIMTIIEKFGPDYKKKKVAMVWVCGKMGSPKPLGVPHSMAIAAGILGMNLTLAYPEGFDLDPKYMDFAMNAAKVSGANIEIEHDINKSVKDAIVIYGRGWGAYGKSAKEDTEMHKPYQDWMIRKEHFKAAAPGAVFMNSMPLKRNLDATSEVVDGPMSAIYDEAENRMHAQKAVMSLLMS
jgi:ornithine carbamoyltransferase